MTPEQLCNVLEAAMLAAGRALTVDDFLALFEGTAEAPERGDVRGALAALGERLEGSALELTEVASGFRLQVRREYSPWLGGLFAERPPRYSRALLETLALIAYRQPITRGEIEDVRGVVVSTNIIKTLMEREWIRVLGHREVPGRPALYGTTREFLDHFGLKSLDGLPALAEIRDLDRVEPDLFAPVSTAPSALPAGGDGAAAADEDAPGIDASVEDEKASGIGAAAADEGAPGIGASVEDEEEPGIGAAAADEGAPGIGASVEDEEALGIGATGGDEDALEIGGADDARHGSDADATSR